MVTNTRPLLSLSGAPSFDSNRRRTTFVPLGHSIPYHFISYDPCPHVDAIIITRTSTTATVSMDSRDSASSTPTSTLTWISWFCSLPGHDYFCEVAEDFIEDDFNLTGLNSMVPFWKEAMEMVLDVEPGTLWLSFALP